MPKAAKEEKSEDQRAKFDDEMGSFFCRGTEGWDQGRDPLGVETDLDREEVVWVIASDPPGNIASDSCFVVRNRMNDEEHHGQTAPTAHRIGESLR